MENGTRTISGGALCTVYFTRFAVQLLWAIAVVAAAGGNHPAAVGWLLVLYPLWDVACTLYEMAAARSANALQAANAGLGVVTAVVIGATVFDREWAAVVAFGGWALLAGLLQLAVGLVRRGRLGRGQWAMILSGAQSALAGAFYITGGLAMKVHPAKAAGYATFGAAYFLVAGVLLARRLLKESRTQNRAATAPDPSRA